MFKSVSCLSFLQKVVEKCQWCCGVVWHACGNAGEVHPGGASAKRGQGEEGQDAGVGPPPVWEGPPDWGLGVQVCGVSHPDRDHHVSARLCMQNCSLEISYNMSFKSLLVLLFAACGHGIPVMTCYSTSRATESRPGRGTELRLSGPAASPVWSKSRTLIQAVKLCPATVPWKPSRCMWWRRVRVRRQRWRIPGSIVTPQSLVKVSRTTLHTNTENKSNITMYSQTSGTRQNVLTHSQTLKTSQTPPGGTGTENSDAQQYTSVWYSGFPSSAMDLNNLKYFCKLSETNLVYVSNSNSLLLFFTCEIKFLSSALEYDSNKNFLGAWSGAHFHKNQHYV